MHVYIAPEPGNLVLRCCTVLLSLPQTCFHPAHLSTPKGAYKKHTTHAAIIGAKFIATTSCQVLVLWMSEPIVATPIASNPRPFDNESYALTNCAITALHIVRLRHVTCLINSPTIPSQDPSLCL